MLAYAPTPSIFFSSHFFSNEVFMAHGIPASSIGMIVSGDLGGTTIYTDRYGRKVVFPKAPPKEPPTAKQTWMRGRFRDAQAEYMSLAAVAKFDYERLTLKASLSMTGQNLFIHVAMMGDFGVLTTLMRQTGVSVIPPTRV